MEIIQMFRELFGHTRLSPVFDKSFHPAVQPATHRLQPMFTSGGSDDRETVQAGRRRKTDQTGERRRAEAPRRREDSGASQVSRPPAGGGGVRPPSMPSMPPIFSGGGGKKPLSIGAILVICLCLVAVYFIGGPNALSSILGGVPQPPAEIPQQTVEPAFEQPAFEEPAAPTLPELVLQPTATKKKSTPAATRPAASVAGQRWLVMLYQDADDKILEQDIYLDLNEAERTGSSERVQVVTQMDRFRGGFSGDGDWTSARRIALNQDSDLQRVRSQTVEDLGEVNMADGETLVDFVTWAVENYPADRHVLILSDHGLGWPGGWSDPTGGAGDPRIPLASRIGDQLFLNELDDALGEIQQRTGIDKFELIGLDACLMGDLEVYSALEPYARYTVASQETEPALGWAYTSFLDELSKNPDMDGAELAKRVVESYIQDDQRIVDDQQRAEFLRQGSPMGGLFGMMGTMSSEQLAQQLSSNVTLSAIDLSAIPQVMDSLNQLAYSMQSGSQSNVSRARSYAQSFTSIFGSDVPASYIDLANFANLLIREGARGEAAQAAQNLLASIKQAVIAEKNGPKKPGASGMSIYFPNSQLFSNPMAGPASYTALANRFAQQSLWDDFLAFHYTNRPFERSDATAAIPQRGASVVAPGEGVIQVSPLRASSRTAAPGQPVTLSADITGENIGQILLFAGYLDRQSNSIFVADMDYLESPETRQVDGVYYPDWGSDKFTLEYKWEPVVFNINDGQDSTTALLEPQSYGASAEEAVYTVDGIYTYTSGEQRKARLYFSDGALRQVFGFTGEGEAGAPREIIPQTGDKFTILEKWMDLNSQGGVEKVAREEGATLTFGDNMFTWEELDAAAGEYVVGFLVQDLDGNVYPVYTQIQVQ